MRWIFFSLVALFSAGRSEAAAIHRRDINYFFSDTGPVTDIQVTNCSSNTSCSSQEWTDIEKNLQVGSDSTTQSNWLSYQSVATHQYITDIKVSETVVSGYECKGNGIYVKYGGNVSQAVSGLDILFGPDAVEVRPDWNLVNTSLQGSFVEGKEPKISFKTGAPVDYKKEFPATLEVRSDGTFKVLQVADLHYSTGYGECLDPVPASSAAGCLADPRSKKFIEEVLDIENPDLILLTGDQVYGPTAPDAETALFKAVAPFIERKIPYAVVLGNHDQESSLDRAESMNISTSLPYSLAEVGPSNIHGYGNYILTVDQDGESVIGFYFLDSGDYNPNGSGYDWIRDDQLAWLESEVDKINRADNYLSLGAFHIPIKNFSIDNDEYVGTQLEAISSGAYQKDVRGVFGKLGANAITVGHDHINDFCDYDVSDENNLWLCYAGGVGIGGYGDQEDGFQRRMRIYQFDTDSGTLTTWKRLENDTLNVFEYITLAKGSVNSFPE